MSISIEQRVTNGVEMLDRRVPNWARCITRPLDIRSLGLCVLGQIFGDWTKGVQFLGIEGDREAQGLYGIELTEDEYSSESVDLIAEQIENEWYSRIKARMGV